MVQSLSVQDAVDHFRKEPWLAKLIDAPGAVVGLPSSRRPKPATTKANQIESQDQLFSVSLNNDTCIPYMLYVHPEVTDRGSETDADPTDPATTPAETGTTYSVPSLALLMDLREGLKGFTSFTHGGFLGAIIDEAMGTLIFTNHEFQRTQEALQQQKDGRHWAPPPGVINTNRGLRMLTAGMNVRFRRPVVLPSIVVATASLSRVDGRKLYFDIEITDEWGYGKGKKGACTTSEGMWLTIDMDVGMADVAKGKL